MGFWTIFLLHLSAMHVAFSQPTTDPNEVAALNKILDHWNLRRYIDLRSDPCAQNASWALDTANPRIACNCAGSTCHVTHLNIYALDVAGEIPKELFALKELMDLNLGQNVLTGVIPPEIGQLTKMQYLSLGINNLTGPVPPEIGNLTQLISLSFSTNSFVGPLPSELGKLTSLQQLYVDSSGVSGPIPLEIGNLQSLITLWASDNLFSGKLPEFLGSLTNLAVLRLQGTLLEGPIPSSFRALTKLEDLRIGELTQAESSLDFLENQTNLTTLILRNCHISGEITGRLGKFTKLGYLDLSFNKLTGQIPNSFQDLTMLQYLYLGNNNLSGQLPVNIISPKLVALDVSWNPITGDLHGNFVKAGSSVNAIGTSITGYGLQDRRAYDKLLCLQGNNGCAGKDPSVSFAIKCGGSEQTSASGIQYDNDSEKLGAASLFTSSSYQWAVSNAGLFISNPRGSRYVESTDSQIIGTLDSELYRTGRISPSSLRYYGLGLENGKYKVDLHFAEIAIEDSRSWKGLGRRLFDVYIQGERVVQDLNIQKEAGGSKRALVKTFETNVTNTVMEIHLFWSGKGTCCIPLQGTYGPLISAIHVSQVSGVSSNSEHDKRKRTGRIVGIVLGSVSGVLIISSILYLWWAKESSAAAAAGRIRANADSPNSKTGLFP